MTPSSFKPDPVPLMPQVGVIALVPDDWNSIWMPRHQLLKRLARYFDVVWINPPRGWRDYWHPAGSHFGERKEFHEIIPGLTIMTPGRTLPRLYRPAWLRRAVLARTLRNARTYLTSRTVKRIALYIWRPEFAEALELAGCDTSCYHIDDEYSFSIVEQPNSPEEMRILRAVDQVIVHSQRLLEKKGGINRRTALIPNGVDYHAFATPQPEPADLAAVPRPRIGYLGVIKKQLDLDQLVRLARARPAWSFVLVGPIGNVSGKEGAIAELRRLANVHFLGHQPVERLASYTQHMDVCLMCYEVNHYTNCIYPLKLHEYLAAGRPAVASPIATVLEHRDVITLASTDEDWLAGIERALRPQTSAELAKRRERARIYDWDTLAKRVAGLFCERLDLSWPLDEPSIQEAPRHKANA